MDKQHINDRADLLSPVFEEGQSTTPLYSVRAEFLTAFFGGPFAIILFSALNANRMGRLKRDAWRYVLVFIATVAFVFWMLALNATDTPPVWARELFGDEFRRLIRWVIRGFSLVVWGMLWLPYRRYHRTAEVMGIAPSNPWLSAIGCVLAGFVVQFLFGVAALELVR